MSKGTRPERHGGHRGRETTLISWATEKLAKSACHTIQYRDASRNRSQRSCRRYYFKQKKQKLTFLRKVKLKCLQVQSLGYLISHSKSVQKHTNRRHTHMFIRIHTPTEIHSHSFSTSPLPGLAHTWCTLLLLRREPSFHAASHSDQFFRKSSLPRV